MNQRLKDRELAPLNSEMGPPRVSRRTHAEWFDSLHGNQVGTGARSGPPPLPPAARSHALSSTNEVFAPDVVCVAVGEAAVASPIEAALRSAGIVAADATSLETASLVVIDAAPDVVAQLAALRAKTRPDAAVLVVVPASAEVGVVGRACSAGAMACLRLPLVPAELVSIVTAALDSRADKRRVETLTRKLDLHAHLASIGRMSAGMTHELVNPLSVASANIDFIREESARLVAMLVSVAHAPAAQLPERLAAVRAAVHTFEEPDGLPGALDETRDAYARLLGLLETMKGLVGKDAAPRSESVDLQLVAKQVVTNRLATETAGVEVEIAGGRVLAAADPVLVEQIVHNLVANAVHAARLLPSPRIRLHSYVSESLAIISVRDNGPGIPAELQEQIFEPFFTTRRGKGGTGLGLALCREYALRMNAELAVWSIPGRGTCFRLMLPASPGR